MQVVVVNEVPIDARNDVAVVRNATPAASNARQSLIRDDAADGLSFAVSRSRWLPAENSPISPRHRHAFQQVRWTESGAVNYGPGQDISAGDLAYFPRGAYYGPQKRDRGVGITIQLGFNGEKQHGQPAWKRYEAVALERLWARGRFEDGAYIEVDPVTGDEHRRDGVQALYEEQYEMRTGEKFVIPDPGYDAPIHIHPAGFEYFTLAPGVEIKELARFYDHAGPNGDIHLAMVRITGGGVHQLGPERAQLVWSTAGVLSLEGQSYAGMTCVYSPRDEKVELSAADRVELCVVEFPRLD